MEVASQIWHQVFLGVQLPRSGAVVEVAPGYEPKIGKALAAIGFCGTIYLVEPDKVAVGELLRVYRDILPKAEVIPVAKAMQDLVVGVDISSDIDAVVASHPFDDMVIGSIVYNPNFFTLEKEDGGELTPEIKRIYDSLTDADYARGVNMTVESWRVFIKKVRPHYFIASQYPSTMLRLKGLTRRQNSGYAVLNQLKKTLPGNVYCKWSTNRSFGTKANPKWWMVHTDFTFLRY
ncbi:MAG: hypothetical protein HY225_01280 [Candidatus Vogelbacteria bacterium]|nr:hypothetical protein [Candidatus Vogelbacteria bacterium]